MNVACIKCGERGVIRVDVGDGDTLTCSECDGEFTVTEVEEFIAEWGALLPWLRAHPARVPECGKAVARG